MLQCSNPDPTFRRPSPQLPDAWRISRPIRYVAGRASKASTLLSLRISLQPIWPRIENRPTAVNCIPADRPFSR
jgi:hypothetical protein